MQKHEIKIYGDIVPFKWFNDGSECDLKDVNSSLSALKVEEGDEIVVGIHTFGGDTATAFGIYNALVRFKDQNNISLTTRVEGWCASSGVIILLAGDKRIGNSYAEPFVHNAWTWTMGDKNKHEKAFEDLARVDDMIANLYAERTSITKEKALELMNADGFIPAEDSLAFGFYTELENVYTAENSLVFNSLRQRNIQNRISNHNQDMSDNKNKKSLWNSLKKQMDDFFGTAKNKIVYTADNTELDFYELTDDATPAVGDKAKYDGKPAGESNDGKYVMPNGETFRFEGEELVEVIPADNDEDIDDAENLKQENQNLKQEVENLKTEISNLKAQNSTLTTEKETINKKLQDATAIINGFKDLDIKIEENEARDPKAADEPKKDTPSATSAINKLRNKGK